MFGIKKLSLRMDMLSRRLDSVSNRLVGTFMLEDRNREMTYGEYIDSLNVLSHRLNENRIQLQRLAEDFMKMSVATESAISLNSQATYEDATYRSQYAARYDGAMMKLRLAWEAMDGPAKGRFEQKCRELNVPFAEPVTGAEIAAQQKGEG